MAPSCCTIPSWITGQWSIGVRRTDMFSTTSSRLGAFSLAMSMGTLVKRLCNPSTTFEKWWIPYCDAMWRQTWRVGEVRGEAVWMPTYDIEGVSVEFPHEAYDCQLEYMRSVVRALEHGENALLESPTGTGKTLALLCASLGWRRHRKEAAEAAKTNWEAHAEGKSFNVPNIFYSSRTHTQLKQVMKELKQTSYKPSSVILGSRQHFCLHSSVMRHSGARQNALCRRAVDEHKCPFYIGFRKCGSKVSTAVKDIEEIVESCKESTVCPYFKVREDAKDAELLLLPYDYLIGQGTRESLQVSLKNSILIFDEGHNIERSCEENASFELTQADIAGAIGELEDAFDLVEQGQVDEEVLKDMPCDAFLKLLNLVKKHLFALEDAISEEKLEKDAVTERMMRKAPGSRVLALLSKPGQRGIATEKEDPFAQLQRQNDRMRKTCGGWVDETDGGKRGAWRL
ncbi:unnamed protein product [Durusdinium trenchii]|uniref:Helicase ATP-binding domain-containing protein n=1 Tax=Durusdinium trenchii TaxID=1381693 RepID=A0ABP0NZ12_9DINO